MLSFNLTFIFHKDTLITLRNSILGFYDGSVAVYNIADEHKRPKHQSTARSGKHTDPVWQVRTTFSLRIISPPNFHCISGSLAER